MASATDFTTSGKVLGVSDGTIVFAPRGTTYELQLKSAGANPAERIPVEARIRVQARKVWTVPSGGNFISPIMGPPKIIQGRVKYADEKQIVVHAGATIIVDLPSADTAVDLPNGPITVGHMVNVTALPGAVVEFLSQDASAPSAATQTLGAGAGSAK